MQEVYFKTAGVVKEIFEIIKFREKKKLDEGELARRFKKVNDAEINFNYQVENMYWEVEQLLNLTPPYFHKEIRKQIRLNIKLVEGEFDKKNLILEIETANNREKYFYKEKTGEKRIGYGPVEKFEKIDLKIISKPYFDEYLQYLNNVVSIFKHKLSFFLTENDETPITTNKPVEHLSNIKSLFTEVDVQTFVLDWRKFESKCHEYTQEIKDEKSKLSYKPIYYDEANKKFHWRGTKKSGIPFLGQFLRRLFELGIIKLFPKEKAARAFMIFFNIPLTKSGPNFLARQFDKTNSSYRKYMVATMKQ